MRNTIVCGAICLFIGFAYAEQRATTADGKQVILKDDNTWRYVTASDKLADKLGKQAADASGTDQAETADKFDLTGGYSVNQKKPDAEDEPPRTALVEVIKGDKGFDVRKAKWGMTREQVKKTESLTLLSDTKDAIEYKFSLMGISSKIRYKFTEGKLSGAEYVIEQDDVNPSRFYDDFKSLKAYLRQQFGTPVADEKNWTNDMYRGEEKNWGFAISLGFLTCKTEWRNPTTKIFLNQAGGRHMINTNIQYTMKQ